MTHTININSSKCTQCGTCARVCPSFVLTQPEAKGKISIKNVNGCIACGHCVDVCPTLAIEHSAFPEENIHEVQSNLLPSPESVMELIRSRRSNRTISGKPISESHLQQIIEAAYYAPTAENSRKVGIHLINTPEELKKIEDSTMKFFMTLANILLHPIIKCWLQYFLKDLYAQGDALMKMKEQWEQGQHPATCDATSMLVFTAPQGYDFAVEDCNLAYQNGSLMAESLGITQIYMGLVLTAVHWMGRRRAAKLFGIDSNLRICALMGLGMPSIKYKRYTKRG